MEKLPTIKLTAGATGRVFNLSELGRPALLVFLWQDTLPMAEVINRAVRDRYPKASQVLIMNVADLRGIPRFVRGMVESELRKVFKETAAKLPKGLNPVEYVILLPDWRGETVKALSLGDVHETPAVAVIDGEGNIFGTYQGDNLTEAALELLEKVEIPAE